MLHFKVCLIALYQKWITDRWPGSYVEITVMNTTSIRLALNNMLESPEDTERQPQESLYHSHLQPVQAHAKPSKQVNLLVQLDGKGVCGIRNVAGTRIIATGLDPRKKYKLRITHMGGANATGGLLEFEGIWVDKPYPQLPKDVVPISVTTESVLGNTVYDREDSKVRQKRQQLVEKGVNSRKIIEIVAPDIPVSLGSNDNRTERILDIVHIWYNQLQAVLPVDTITLPTSKLTLVPSTQPGVTISDIFFRSGPPASPHFLRPWSFKSYVPSVLILQLGLVDFMAFFADEENHNKHAVDKFTNEFVNACVRFVRTIRKTAYPSGSTSGPWMSSAASQEDGTYIYNSAPSTLPIFLMAPFSASCHFISKRMTFDRLISDALSQVASTLQADGDKSTFWIDTTGWLNPNDFLTKDTNSSTSQPPQSSPLTRVGNDKVARLLAAHICPYVNDRKEPEAGATENCPFDRYDHYLGNVYLPQDVEFDRAMLERKIATIKERFGVGHV